MSAYRRTLTTAMPGGLAMARTCHGHVRGEGTDLSRRELGRPYRGGAPANESDTVIQFAGSGVIAPINLERDGPRRVAWRWSPRWERARGHWHSAHVASTAQAAAYSMLGMSDHDRYTERLPSGSSSVGRASASQAEGRGFETLLPLHFHTHQSQQNVAASVKRRGSRVLS